MNKVIQTVIPEDIINLSFGQPSLSLLPLDLLQKANTELYKDYGEEVLQYGALKGNYHFREYLAEYLSSKYATHNITPENLFISCGTSFSIDLLTTLLAQSGETVFVEDPTYLFAISMFKEHNLNVEGIPVDGEGIRVDLLEEKLQHVRPKFLYTIPVYQNPAGVTLSEERRKRLIELSEQYDFFIIADEAYLLLPYSSDYIAPLSWYDTTEQGRVYSLGSFSKILSPGIRLGWVDAAPHLLERLEQCSLLYSGAGLNPFMSAIISGAFKLNLFDGHIAELRRIYRQRAEFFIKILRDTFTDQATVHDSAGGYYIWIEFSEQIDLEKYFAEAERFGIDFRPGSWFSVYGNFKNCIRLSVAFHSGEELARGAERLRRFTDYIDPLSA